MHILFVCTGNICRSPTAERLAAMYGSARQIPHFTTSSAGTHAVIGHPIHVNASIVLRSMGGESGGFAARQLTIKTARSADLIITMTKGQRDAVLGLVPQKLRYTFTIGEAAALAGDLGAPSIAEMATLRPRLDSSTILDVPDPIGHDLTVFERVGAQISDLLGPIVDLCHRSAVPG